MNRNSVCDIARDLMPLAIDGAASGSSQKFVEEHTAMCPECAKVYRAMQSAQPDAAAPDESDRAFGRSMKRMRKKRRFAALLASLLAVVALATAGAIGYSARFPTISGRTPAEQLEFGLVQLPTGRVILYAKAKDEGLRIGSESYQFEPGEDGENDYFTVTTFSPLQIAQWKPNTLVFLEALWLIDGQLYRVDRTVFDSDDGTKRIAAPVAVSSISYEDPDGVLTLYSAGDAIETISLADFLDLREELMCGWDDLLPQEYEEAPLYARCAAELIRNGGRPTENVSIYEPPVNSTLSEPAK